MIFCRPLSIILLTLACSGCFGTQANSVYQAQQSGDLNQAASIASSMATKNETGVDRVLWQLEAGLSAFWTGQHELSRTSFAKASQMIDELDERSTVSVRSVGSKMASLMWNDTVMPYLGSPSDRVALHTYQALNYLVLNDFDGAKVELRKARTRRQESMEQHRSEIEAQRKKKKGNGLIQDQLNQKVRDMYGGSDDDLSVYRDFTNPFNVLLEGLVFYHGAADAGEKAHGEMLLNTLQGMMQWSENPLSNLNTSRGFAVFERGQAPVTISRSVSVPLLIQGRLTHLHVAIPFLSYSTQGSLDVQVGGQNMTKLLNTRDLFQEEFSMRLPSLIMSRLASVSMKALLEYQVAKENTWLGLGASLLQTLGNRADTRSWRGLPAEMWCQNLGQGSSENVELKVQGRTQKVGLPKHQATLLLIKHTGDDTPVILSIPLGPTKP
jgi:hypothetical protein